MNQQSSPLSSDVTEPLVITLELVSGDEEGNRDIAFVSAIGRDTAETLQRDGYILRPIYTGQRGGPFLVEVVNTVSQLTAQVWANRTALPRIW